MNWKTPLVLFGLVSAITIPVLADSHKTEGRMLSELTFSSIDRHSNGYIHQGDLEEFRDSVFAGMDSDDNNSITYQEFRSWDPGFSYLADERSKLDTYDTAIRVVFAFWDRDADGEISTSEMRHAMSADFRRADLNDDAVLSEDEFLNGFTIIVAIKAAFRPDL